MNEIFYSGPYTINNRPIILKLWTVDFDFSKEFPITIPLWVKFPKLLMSCWGKGSLSRIASVIGVPIYADECTAKQTRISYARMLIEVNVTQPLPDKITVMDLHEKVFEQEVLYDWKPKFFPKCSMVGHVCQTMQQQTFQLQKKQGTRKVEQEWKPTGVIREPAPEIKEASVQKQVEDKPSQGAKGKMVQVDTNLERRIAEVPQSSTSRIQNGEVVYSPELNLTDFPLLGSWPKKNAWGNTSRRLSEYDQAPPDKGEQPHST
ncbi:uncharacterized protein LOC129869834 [Solanum dulcamara]|uniref:uncharacterized protein LOC129869834 n=1 Tax=Solanum dulcamara TaxID=45834 RepID=UPI0024864D31|nr:uncharacterized protein LOC129869834 [Solanum dulcamara]